MATQSFFTFLSQAVSLQKQVHTSSLLFLRITLWRRVLVMDPRIPDKGSIKKKLHRTLICLQKFLRRGVYLREVFSLLGTLPPSSYRQELRRICVHFSCNIFHISVLEGFLI